MNRYITQTHDRLDTIAYHVYGSVNATVMAAIMEANPHALEPAILPFGETIYLPDIDVPQEVTEVKALW